MHIKKNGELSKAIKVWNSFLNHQSADKDLTLTLELDANFYQAYYNRGTLLAQLGYLE